MILLPSLSLRERSKINDDISREEVEVAIKNIKVVEAGGEENIEPELKRKKLHLIYEES